MQLVRSRLSLRMIVLKHMLSAHLPFKVLKRRMPSAGPQIWIRSSLLILKRSAPATTAGRLFCHYSDSKIFFTSFAYYVLGTNASWQCACKYNSSIVHSVSCLFKFFFHLRSWRRALRKVRTCDVAATAECPAVRTMAQGATCQKEKEPLK